MSFCIPGVLPGVCYGVAPNLVAMRQPGRVGEGVVRIYFNRLIKVIDRRFIAALVCLFQKKRPSR